ncbi:ABC transporter permease [Rhizobium sp.]|jgi:spermidine/putrescine transport system permease protein|uniref:ABC transporter permease n=1 Tax=Rhizobium sp. TaxID=391 RepID=UPI000E88C780|nr:spermidine/putrescine ABC transporter permease PotC [Rhizobium sp.]
MTARFSLTRLLQCTHVIAFFLFLYLPIVMLIIYSFNDNATSMMSWNGFTFDWYLRVLVNLGIIAPESGLAGATNLQLYSDPNLSAAAKNSVIVAISASSLATVIGTSTALGLARTRFKGRTAYRTLLFLPIVIPDIVLGIALLVFMASISFPLGRISVIIAHTVFLASYVNVVVGARLAGMDERLEEASADLGANRWTTFRRITLPLLMPGIAGGFLLSLVISFDDLVIAYFTSGVGSTTLPVYLFGAIKRNVSPEINAVSVLMILISTTIAMAALLLRRKNADPGQGNNIA